MSRVAGPRRSVRRVDVAIQLASVAHAGQYRKDGRTPYIVHPVGVLRFLSTTIGVTDENLLTAAVLHDVLEDTAVTSHRLRTRFGPRVLALVEELTIPAEFHGPQVPDSAKTRALVRALSTSSWEAVLLKLADRYDNLEDMANAHWSAAKRRAYRAQTRTLLRVIAERWHRGPPPPSLAPLLRAAQGRVGHRLRPARRI